MFNGNGKGDALIAKGLGDLTAAIGKMEKGVGINNEAVVANEAAIVKLQEEAAALRASNAQANTVVANFRKNILGETDVVPSTEE